MKLRISTYLYSDDPAERVVIERYREILKNHSKRVAASLIRSAIMRAITEIVEGDHPSGDEAFPVRFQLVTPSTAPRCQCSHCSSQNEGPQS